MSNTERWSFPANIVLPGWTSFLTDRIKDPLGLTKIVDRCLGFIYWDFSSKLSYLKLILLTTVFSYVLLSCFCVMFLINPSTIHPDLYLRMGFIVGAGGSCFTRITALIPTRHHFAAVHQFLDDIHRQKAYHPLRSRSRPVIFLYSASTFTTNSCIAIFWTMLLLDCCPMVYAFHDPTIRWVSLSLWPVVLFLNGMIANGTTLTMLTTMLVFAVEFDIIAIDLREAFNAMDLGEVRKCIMRHQRLLEMVTLFRQITKLYFLIAMGLYFFLVTFSCLLLVVQLHEGNIQAMQFNAVNSAIPIVSIVLYGKICDMLEERVRNVGDHAYDSDWSSKLVCVRGRKNEYQTLKCSLLMVMARSQKKVGFTCGGIFEMSTVTSMQALKMFYSAFTILWNATSD